MKGKSTKLKVISVSIPIEKLSNVENTYVTDHLVRKAQLYAQNYRPGETPSPCLAKQYRVIRPATMEHFEKWILSPARTEPLKMRETHIAARHVLGLKEPRYTTYPRYKTDCKKKNVVPLPREVYTDMLGMREFMKLKQDDCMCAKCLKYGWRGIVEEKKGFFKTLQTLGKRLGIFKKNTDPTHHLSKRLDAAWNHMRTTYSQHLQSEDEIASHCLRHQLGHSCNHHLDTPCSHTRTDGVTKCHPVRWADEEQTSGNRSLAGRWDAHCEVCERDCETGGGRTVSSKSMKCRHCCHSCCNDCHKKYYPAEGPDENFVEKSEYICNECSSEIGLVRHRPGGCGLCDDLEHLPVDLVRIVDKIKKVAGIEATKDLCFKVKRFVQNFKDFKHHMARVAQQELHWPSVLKTMRDEKQYDKVCLVFIRSVLSLFANHNTQLIPILRRFV